jgi:hypothetical protein
MGMMLGGHMKANDMLTVFQRHASSSELKSLFADGQSTVVAHLRHAKELVKKLESRPNDPRPMDEDRK